MTNYLLDEDGCGMVENTYHCFPGHAGQVVITGQGQFKFRPVKPGENLKVEQWMPDVSSSDAAAQPKIKTEVVHTSVPPPQYSALGHYSSIVGIIVCLALMTYVILESWRSSRTTVPDHREPRANQERGHERDDIEARQSQS